MSNAKRKTQTRLRSQQSDPAWLESAKRAAWSDARQMNFIDRLLQPVGQSDSEGKKEEGEQKKVTASVSEAAKVTPNSQADEIRVA